MIAYKIILRYRADCGCYKVQEEFKVTSMSLVKYSHTRRDVSDERTLFLTVKIFLRLIKLSIGICRTSHSNIINTGS